MLKTTIRVRHAGRAETHFWNTGSRPVTWKACFPGGHDTIVANGTPLKTEHDRTEAEDEFSYVRVRVEPGHKASATLNRK